MMCHRHELGEHFPKVLVNLAWTHLLNETETSPSESISQLVFTSSNDEEFEFIIKELLLRTVSLYFISSLINNRY